MASRRERRKGDRPCDPPPRALVAGRPVSLRSQGNAPSAGQPADSVGSYFGMRKIALGKMPRARSGSCSTARRCSRSALDQGYWPDGIYTAPTDEALRHDIEMTMKLGFNAMRKHVKVEPDRWYYWCDRLGLLVWQDMPSVGGQATPATTRQFEAELRAMVEGLANDPAVIMWVIFNEGWGQYDTERLSAGVKRLNPTRWSIA